MSSASAHERTGNPASDTAVDYPLIEAREVCDVATTARPDPAKRTVQRLTSPSGEIALIGREENGLVYSRKLIFSDRAEIETRYNLQGVHDTMILKTPDGIVHTCDFQKNAAERSITQTLQENGQSIVVGLAHDFPETHQRQDDFTIFTSDKASTLVSPDRAQLSHYASHLKLNARQFSDGRLYYSYDEEDADGVWVGSNVVLFAPDGSVSQSVIFDPAAKPAYHDFKAAPPAPHALTPTLKL